MHRFLVAVDYILPERSVKYFLCLSVKLGTVSLSMKELAWRVSSMVLFLCLVGGSQPFLVKLIFDFFV